MSVTSVSASVISDFDESQFPDTSIKQQQEYIFSPDSSYLYSKPRPFQWAKQIPSDLGRFFKVSFSKKNLWKTAAILGASAIMVVYDQQMLDGTQHFGRQIHIDGKETTVAPIRWTIKLGDTRVYMPLYFPANFNTGMYFLGDGFTHFSIAAGFWTVGKIKKDNHALQTASQLLESLVTIGIITQTLKHITGRESPYTSTTKGGKWKFFPNQSEYAKHVPNHDAFPSGHLATWVSTFTVLSENYPDCKWIPAVGYGLGTCLAFAMVNNGVHWVADYPLAIGIGYVCGKIVAARGHEVKYNKKFSFLSKAKPGIVLPSFSGHITGLQAIWQL